jgi:hypothetical protein
VAEAGVLAGGDAADAASGGWADGTGGAGGEVRAGEDAVDAASVGWADGTEDAVDAASVGWAVGTGGEVRARVGRVSEAEGVGGAGGAMGGRLEVNIVNWETAFWRTSW